MTLYLMLDRYHYLRIVVLYTLFRSRDVHTEEIKVQENCSGDAEEAANRISMGFRDVMD